MLPRGLEPRTFRLLAERSNQLSYESCASIAQYAGLAGMGDMIATCTSPQSRNRHVGIQLGMGRNMEEIVSEMVMVAEGVKSAPAVLALAEQYKVDTPIFRDVYRVLSGDTSATRTFRGLLRVEAGAESEPG